MRKKHFFAFTMMELIVVIGVVAIIAAAFLINYNDDSISVANAAERVAEDLRYMRSMSQSHGLTYGIIFNPTGEITFDEYSLMVRNIYGTVEAYRDPVRKTTTNLEDDLGIYRLGEIAYANGTQTPAHSITFDSKGVPYTDFNLSDITPNIINITLSKNGDSVRIKLIPNSGDVQIENL